MIIVHPIHAVASLSTSTMINWEGTRLLLDVGPGTITEIWRRGLRLRGLKGILLSHAHLDHLWGLPPLLWFLNQRNWRRPITILHLAESSTIIERLVNVAGTPEFTSLLPLTGESESYSFGHVTIRTFPVHHSSTACGFIITEPAKATLDTLRLTAEGIPKQLWSALAKNQEVQYNGQLLSPQNYLLKPKQRKIVYTGDTGPTSTLHQYAQNADLLICDSSWVYPQWHPPEEAPHLTLRQVLELAKKAHVHRLLLTHLTYMLSLEEYRQAVETLRNELKISFPIYFPNEERIDIP